MFKIAYGATICLDAQAVCRPKKCLPFIMMMILIINLYFAPQETKYIKYQKIEKQGQLTGSWLWTKSILASNAQRGFSKKNFTQFIVENILGTTAHKRETYLKIYLNLVSHEFKDSNKENVKTNIFLQTVKSSINIIYK